MKKFLLLIFLLTGTAKADMYYECSRTDERWYDFSDAPTRIDLDITDEFVLRLNGKVVIEEMTNDDYYKPILKVERSIKGKMEIAHYHFDGSKCDSEQTGSVLRFSQFGNQEISGIAGYTCVCGED